jgi:hypothetical protein
VPTEHPVEWNWLESDATGKEFMWRILQKGNKNLHILMSLKYALVLSTEAMAKPNGKVNLS